MWQLYQIEVGLWLSSRTFGEYFEYEKDIAIMNPHQRRERKVSTVSAASDSESTTQQATPS